MSPGLQQGDGPEGYETCQNDPCITPGLGLRFSRVKLDCGTHGEILLFVHRNRDIQHYGTSFGTKPSLPVKYMSFKCCCC